MCLVCASCAARRLKLARLRAENAQLRRRVADLEGRLRTIAGYAGEVVDQADRTLSQHQPRGKWAYAKAARAVANRVRHLAM